MKRESRTKNIKDKKLKEHKPYKFSWRGSLEDFRKINKFYSK